MAVGEGAFSSVVRARQPHLDRLVAVKILEERDETRRREWLEEAKTLAQLRLDCVPEVYDAVESGGRIFIVMQWLRGVSLQAILEKNPGGEERKALAGSLCSALARLHAAGFAHRDLKPENILLCPEPEGRIYLLDFGFARKYEAGKQSMSGMVKGTPAYMAPELWHPGPVDFFKSDLFALGRILREIKPGPEWEDGIARLLAEDPARRPVSALEWRRQSENFLPRGHCDWKLFIGPLTAENMSVCLRQGAQNLMAAGRHEEAYWLLAESLEENPDSEESLRLLQSLPALSGKKTVRRRWASLAVASVILLGLAAAFFFGRESERGRRGLVLNMGESKLFLPPKSKSGVWISADFKSKDLGSDSRLSGFLQLRGSENCGKLLLDGNPLSTDQVQRGLVLPFGDHALECRDGSGRILGREQARVLPFQKKTIRFPMGKQG